MSEPGQNLAQIASVAIMSNKDLQAELKRILEDRNRRKQGSPPPDDTGSRPDTPPPPSPPSPSRTQTRNMRSPPATRPAQDATMWRQNETQTEGELLKIVLASYLQNIQKTDVDQLMKAELKEEGATNSFRVLGDFNKYSFFFCKSTAFPTPPGPNAPWANDWCDAEIRFNEVSDSFVMKFKEKQTKVEWILEFRIRNNRDVCTSTHVSGCQCNMNSPYPDSLYHMAEEDINILYSSGGEVHKAIHKEKNGMKMPLLKQKKKKPHLFPVQVLCVTKGEEAFPILKPVYGNIVVLTAKEIPIKIDKQYDIAKEMGVRCYSPRQIAKNYLEEIAKKKFQKPDKSTGKVVQIRLQVPNWDACTDELLTDEVVRTFTIQLKRHGMLI